MGDLLFVVLYWTWGKFLFKVIHDHTSFASNSNRLYLVSKTPINQTDFPHKYILRAYTNSFITEFNTFYPFTYSLWIYQSRQILNNYTDGKQSTNSKNSNTQYSLVTTKTYVVKLRLAAKYPMRFMSRAPVNRAQWGRYSNGWFSGSQRKQGRVRDRKRWTRRVEGKMENESSAYAWVSMSMTILWYV